MRTRHRFLQDDSAIQEIRKHKWIESEKAGREIGFATAAVDWITKYGETWLAYRRQHSAQQNTVCSSS